MNKLIKTNTKLKAGDEVVVIAGKDIGKKGNIRKIMKNNNRAIVTGINMIKKHTKPNPQMGVTGGLLSKRLQLIYPIFLYGILRKRVPIRLSTLKTKMEKK